MQQAGDPLGHGHGAPANTPGAGVLWIDPPLAGPLGVGVVTASFAAPEAAARAREAEAGLWLWTPGSADGEVLAPLQAQGRATAENAWRKAFADHLAMGGLLVLCAAPDEHQLHTPEALVDSGWPHSLPVPLVTEVATAAGARCVAGEPFASFLAAHEGLFAPRLALRGPGGRTLMLSRQGQTLALYLNDARGRLLVLPALDPARVAAQDPRLGTLPRALLSLALRLGVPAARAALDPQSGLAPLQRELRAALAQRHALEARIAQLGTQLDHLARIAPLAAWGRGGDTSAARFDAAYAVMSMLRDASIHAAMTEDDEGLVLAGHDGRWCALVLVDGPTRTDSLARAARLLDEVSVTGGASLAVRRDAEAAPGLAAGELASQLSRPGREVRAWFESVAR